MQAFIIILSDYVFIPKVDMVITYPQDYMWCHHLNDDVQSATPTWSKPQTN